MPRGIYVLLALIFFFLLKINIFEQSDLRIYWTDFHQIYTIL